MTVQRSERFDTDLERQFRWYLLETDLDPVDALALATRFAQAVEAALDSLQHNPQIGRHRFKTYPELAGTRSWRVRKPFHRFMIFYRCEKGILFAERLLEGHSRLAHGDPLRPV
jgi:plasmid stabilization system protein ParE